MDSEAAPLGKIKNYQQNGAEVIFAPERGALRVSFLDSKTFRIEADPSGTFRDPANTPQNDPARTANLVVGKNTFVAPELTVVDGSQVTMGTSELKLSIDKSRGSFTLRQANGREIFREESPLRFGKNSTTQTFAPRAGEQFLGGGMQNGRVVHTGQTINITKDFNWEDGGNPNAVPYYMSSSGYGVFRNTLGLLLVWLTVFLV